MFIKRIIKFILHKRKAGDTKNLAIRMRVTIKGERPFDFPLGRKVDLDKWDADRERAIGSDKETAETNRAIEEYKAQINEVFARFELLEKRIPTPQEVKDLFNDMIGKASLMDENKHLDLWAVFDLFMEQVGKKNQWTPSTHKKFRTIKGHLKSFAPKLNLNELTEKRMQEFVYFLQNKDFRNTTISKYISYIRWFLRWSHLNGYYDGNLHETFKPKFKGVSTASKEIIYLSQQELQQLQKFEFQENQLYLEKVRDVFLFQCFTGLRYSDVAKLRRTDIKGDVIHVVTQKTVDGLRIELNKHSRGILDKYKNNKFPDNKALPIISNVKMNAYLKVLGRIAGLDEPTRLVYFMKNERIEEVHPKWELLTTHVARRTFVVSALQLGIAPEVIMRWTGHSDYDAMKPYIAIVDELKQKSMSKFDLI